MKTYNSDCFAIVIPEDEKNEKTYCRALAKIDCEGCPFYKKKESIKNNIFYKYSYEDMDNYSDEVKDYKRKYNVNNTDILDN